MPTAAKLFGAFAFALVAFFTAEVLKPSFPEGFSFGYFSLVCALLGIIAGWRVMGAAASPSQIRSIGLGLKTSFVMTVWALVVFSIREMLLRSVDRRYGDVVEAIEGVFGLMLEFAQLLFSSTPALAVLIVGGALGGMFSSWAAARWR